MGTKERRERERHERRQAILQAARTIAGEEGWQAVTIRRVADSVEYSPPTIYEHFASKDAMLLELMRAGFAALLEAMQHVSANAPSPEARVLALAQTYWDFAWEHPEMYQVMHGLGGVPFCSDSKMPLPSGALDEADGVYTFTLDALRDVAAPGMSQGELENVVIILWATLHGLVALTMADRIDGGCACAAPLVERAVRGVLAAHLKGTSE